MVRLRERYRITAVTFALMVDYYQTEFGVDGGGLENKKGMRERKHCVHLQIAWQDSAERLEAT